MLLIVTSREHIRISQHRFTGAPSFDADGNIIVANPDPMRYVGDPRVYPEIDHNWNELTWGELLFPGRAILIIGKSSKSSP